MKGGGGDDSLSGGAGNDTLTGGDGDDYLAGGIGDDSYIVDDVGDVVVEEAGNGADSVQAGFSYTLTANVEVLRLTGIADINGAGNDLGNTLYGNAGANMLLGQAGNDTLLASDGDDTLDGGVGVDQMHGGKGNDLYLVDNSSDDVIELANEGVDHVVSAISYTLQSNVEHLTLIGAADLSGTGNDLANVIIGNSGSNALEGNAGDDTLQGGSGDDTLDGGLGSDSMVGGAGNDTFYVDNSGDFALEQVGGGVDQVVSLVSHTLADNIENLRLAGAIAALTGTGNSNSNTLEANNAGSSLRGEGGFDVLLGGNGNDILDGGVGADTMSGGRGDDSYFVDNANDVIVETMGEGVDTVFTTVSLSLAVGSNLENLTLGGADDITGVGNELANLMAGNSGSNEISGGAGNDTLFGGGGNDTLDGGTGVDILVGDFGDDTYHVDSASDVISEAFGQGYDTVSSTVSYALSEHFEDLLLTGTALGLVATGNAASNVLTANLMGSRLNGLAGSDTLIGRAGNDILDGGLGVDDMSGWGGDDLYFVDDSADTVFESASGGTDSVSATVSYTLSDNVENLTLMGGSAGLVARGNAQANVLTANSAGSALEGGNGNDILIGAEGDDTLDGQTGADSMTGGLGDDTYYVDDIRDWVSESDNAGYDHVVSSVTHALADHVENLTLTGNTAGLAATGNTLANVLTANNGGSTLSGLAGNDTLVGGDGGDVLEGGEGADSMTGGLGDDTYDVDDAGDVITEAPSEGTDQVNSTVSYALADHVENLTLTGSTSSLEATGNTLANVLKANKAGSTLSGLAGDDTLVGGDGGDVLEGGAGADSMTGGLGDDIYGVDDAGDVITEALAEGTDQVNSTVSYALADHVENLTLTGSTAGLEATGNSLANVLTANNGGSTLSGLAGNDTLVGGDGGDVLEGGTGADSMTGGLGDDVYLVDSVGDTVTEAAAAGADLVNASVSYTLSANVENLTLTGTSASLIATGNTLANVLRANNAGSTLSGLDGDDTLVGGDGRDFIDGGAGADSMVGGAGNDTYLVDNAGDLINEAAGSGTDTVLTSITYALQLGNNIENLTLTGTLSINGAGNELSNVLIGNIAANTLSGGAGDDTLDGGAGADSMMGGLGNDTYFVESAGDIVTEALSEGTDRIVSTVSYTLSANVENLTLIASAAGLVAIGNAQSNVLAANSMGSMLQGLAGNDTLQGGAGNDTLDGGSGRDVMSAGLGNDTYYVDDAVDMIVEIANAGTDLVYASVDHTLSDNIENLTLSGTLSGLVGNGNALANVLTANNAGSALFGNAGNDTLFGGSANDTLDGGTGEDSMVGGLGDDVYLVDSVGDTVTEAESAGKDVIRSSLSYALGTNIESLILTGNAAVSGSGNALDNDMVGNEAANTLDGGAGADTMIGGAGDDIYVVDNVGDVVTESESSGRDTVRSSMSYALGANVENLVLLGSAAINATGNGLNNDLSGNDGANVLDGGAGADTMSGGAGDDTYLVDNVGDVVTESETGGRDTVRSSVSYALGANVENLILLGGAAVNATGNTLNNELMGNGGANVLDGGLGADTMSGGAGDDTYMVDSVGDVVTELETGGRDTVRSSVSYALGANVENLVLLGSAAVNGTGNALNNDLVGNDGANVLDGGAGADTMIGGAGDDTYVVDSVGDVVTESETGGRDMVRSSVSYALGANVENLVLLGSAAVNGTGNALNNDLVGNDGANVLDGGAGADTMSGGAGDDIYFVDSVDDSVTESVNSGNDTIKTTLTNYVLGSNVENLTLLGNTVAIARANDLDNVINGNAFNNIVSGGLGRDTLIGGGGDDILDGETSSIQRMFIQSTTGGYQVRSFRDLQLVATFESVEPQVQAGGHGSSIAVTGSSTVDKVYVGLGSTVDARNLLGGTDEIHFSRSFKEYSVSATAVSGALVLTSTSLPGVAEKVTVSNGTTTTGRDRLVFLDGSLLTHELRAHISAGTTPALDATRKSNLLDYGFSVSSQGADSLVGGTGNDTFVVDDVGDTVVELVSEGVDQVFSYLANFTLGANIENLQLAGVGNQSGVGNELDNIIIGNVSSNVLTGGAGADKFVFNTRLDELLNVDAVTDFSTAHGDRIALDKSIFNLLAGKTSLVDHFRLSTQAAAGGDDFIVYDQASGKLGYDTSGTGSMPVIVFASIQNRPLDLSGQHFAVI